MATFFILLSVCYLPYPLFCVHVYIILLEFGPQSSIARGIKLLITQLFPIITFHEEIHVVLWSEDDGSAKAIA
jgi:hypothetical protein